MKKIKPIWKMNGGKGATLCYKCSVIISIGLTEDLYCERCKQKQDIIDVMKSDEALGLYEESTKCYCGHTTYCDCGPEEHVELINSNIEEFDKAIEQSKQECMITKIMQMDAEMAYDSLPKQDKIMERFIANAKQETTLEDKLKLLVEEWHKRQLHYEEVAEDNITSEHNNRKFTYKAMATRDCWKELLKLIEDEK